MSDSGDVCWQCVSWTKPLLWRYRPGKEVLCSASPCTWRVSPICECWYVLVHLLVLSWCICIANSDANTFLYTLLHKTQLVVTRSIWGAVCVKIYYWQTFRKVWGFTKLVDIYVNHSGNLTWITEDIILEVLQLYGFMKVYSGYLRIGHLVNCSQGPSLCK